MKRKRSIMCTLFAVCLVLNLLTSSVNGETVVSDISDDFAKSYNYIFIGTVLNKTIESNQTHYLFNVTENLKKPINTTQITVTTMGGSEIAVSPSTSFYIGKEYLVFFDELDEDDMVIGFDYYASLLSQVGEEKLETIREIANSEPNIDEQYRIPSFTPISIIVGLCLIFSVKKNNNPSTTLM